MRTAQQYEGNDDFLFWACQWQQHISVSVREAWDLSALKLTGQEMCTKQSFLIFEGDIIQRRQTWRKWRQKQTIIAARNTSLVCLISVSCWDKNKLLIQLVWIAIQLNRVRGVMCVAPYYYGTAQLHNLMVKCSAHRINSAHNCTLYFEEFWWGAWSSCQQSKVTNRNMEQTRVDHSYY